jgi:hypothetical protein
MTVFKTLVNNLRTSLGANYTAGSGTMTVAPGTGTLFGSISTAAPARFTVITAATYGTSSEVLTIYQATGLSGDVLSGVSAIEGTTDLNYSAGDKLEARPTQGSYADIHGAINAIENAPYAVDNSVVHRAGSETITGAKTFSTPPTVGNLTGLLKATTGTITTAAPGTDYVVPTGSITGTAANVSGIVAVANGGTGRNSVGSSDQLLGVTHSGGSLEYKTLTAGSNITITPTAGAITIAASGGGGGSPGGSNTQIQYNNNGVFAGSSSLTFDGINLACAGNVSVGGANPLVQTSATSLNLKQTGDSFGETGLILKNRSNANGAVFYNSSTTANLVDFQFQNQNTNNFSLRTEGRTSAILGNGNNASGYSEMQFVAAMAPTPCIGAVIGNSTIVLCPANSPTAMNNPRVGIWQTNPAAMLHVQASSGSKTGTIVQGATSQASDLMQWQNSSGTVLSRVMSSGEIAGPLAMVYASKSAAYTVTAQDSFIAVSGSSSWALTLPAANSVVAGHIYTFKRTDNNRSAITIVAAGTDKIDGASTYNGLSARYKYLQIVSDGSANWWNVGSN